MNYRFDFVFSYWLFAWYILYEFKIVSYNPKIAIIIGIIENILILCLMIYFENSFIYIFLFCFVNTFLKLLPLWSLRNTNYEFKDVYALIKLFIIYLLWLIINNLNLKNSVKDKYYQLKNNKPIAPFTYYIDKYLLHN
jgi:hypothetical protein